MMKDIESMLEGKSRKELLAIISGLARDVPGVTGKLRDRARLERGRVGELVGSIKGEMRALASCEPWPYYGGCDDDAPDYAGLESRLGALYGAGYADEVFGLGRELLGLVSAQIEAFGDDWRISMGIAGCMEVVLKALPDTKLPRTEQLLWLLDALREDGYGLLDGAGAVLDDPRYGKGEWRALGAVLDQRLREMPVAGPEGWQDRSLRRTTLAQLVDVYRRGGEKERIIPLLEREADLSWEYDALVERLMRAGKRERERARYWCVRGYERTVGHAPAVAAQLRQRLLSIAEKEGDTMLAAAYRAGEFFERPSVGAFEALGDAAGRAGVWPAVREALLGYLRSGSRPDRPGAEPAWPLPETEVGGGDAPEKRRAFPHRELLIRIAIHERRSEDAVAEYRELSAGGQAHRGISEEVAGAVSATHPDLSLEIWRERVEELIAEVKPKAYVEASGYLQKMQEVYRTTGRLEEWRGLLLELRSRHRAKRRLMEVLDGVEKGGRED